MNDAQTLNYIDEPFYRKLYSLDSEVNSSEHFIAEGFENNYFPNAITNLAYIKNEYEVKTFEEFNAFIHSNAGNPSPYFDTQYYLSNNKDVSETGISASVHFLNYGFKEKRSIHKNHKLLYNEISDIFFEEFQLEHPEKINVKNIIPLKDNWKNDFISNHLFKAKESGYIEKSDKLNYKNNKKVIAIIADLNLPQCKKYRIYQKVEYLQSQGHKVIFSHWNDVARSTKFLQFATSLILYRVPSCQLVSNYFEEARRLNLNVFYDIDDPIFDAQIYSQNRNLDYLGEDIKTQVFSGIEAHTNAIKQADYLISSTPFLAEVLNKVNSNPVFIWPNLIDKETLTAVDYIEKTNTNKSENENFNIVYMSGSKAHEGDFTEALPALLTFMIKNTNVYFKSIGYNDSIKILKTFFPDRVTIKDFQDYFGYLKQYQNADLNIIPLIQDDFNKCKSAIRWQESSLMGVPSLISNTGDFTNLVKDKETGFLIENNDWLSSLNKMLNNDSLKQVGLNAKNYVENNLKVDNLLNYIDAKILELL